MLSAVICWPRHRLSKAELEDILDPWEDATCSGPHLLPAEPAFDFPGAWERLHAEGLMPEPNDQRKVGADLGT